MPQSTTLGLHPVIHVPNYMDHYSLLIANLQLSSCIVFSVVSRSQLFTVALQVRVSVEADVSCTIHGSLYCLRIVMRFVMLLLRLRRRFAVDV